MNYELLPMNVFFERRTGIGPVTFSLARRHSTGELPPLHGREITFPFQPPFLSMCRKGSTHIAHPCDDIIPFSSISSTTIESISARHTRKFEPISKTTRNVRSGSAFVASPSALLFSVCNFSRLRARFKTNCFLAVCSSFLNYEHIITTL